MPIGNPISLTNNVATATLVVSATQDQTAFTVTGGYRINKLGVFRNGVRLNASDDFIALDGATVTLIEPCAADDEIVFEVQDDFRVADAIVSAASTQTISGNLVVTGEVYPGTITLTQINASGVITATTFDGDLNGNATTATTAGSLSGTPELSVSTITGVAATFTGNVTIGGTLTYEDVTNIDSVGVITARNGIVVNNNGINVSSGIVTASSFDATDFVSVANSIRHRGDANTTIGFAGNDEIELRTNGLDRLSIKSNGNVVLDNFSSTSGRGKLAFGNSTQWFIESLDANAGGDARFTINEGSDEFLRIDTAGDVGIGTANPLDKLHLFNETSSGLRLETPSGIALLSMVQSDGNIANGTIAGDLAIRGQSGISLSPDNGTSTAVRVVSDGKVGIGITNPDIFHNSANHLVVSGTPNSGVTIHAQTTGGSGNLWFADGLTGSDRFRGMVRYEFTNDDMVFKTAGDNERARIDNSGRIIVGFTTTRNTNSRVQINNTGDAVELFRNTSDAGGSRLSFTKSRNSAASPATVSDGDGTGEILFKGWDGDSYENCAKIEASVDGSASAGAMPGRLEFYTTPTSSITATERFRMGSGGQFGVGGANYGSSGQVLTSGGPNAAPSWADAGGGNPAGTVIQVAMNSAPSGYVKCDGAAISRTTFSDLFDAIGTTWGAGDGSSTFNVPDLRGEFVRGWDDGKGTDSGRAFASSQAEEINTSAITGALQAKVRNPGSNSGSESLPMQLASGNTGNWQNSKVRFNGSGTGSETRPRNIALLYCIKT